MILIVGLGNPGEKYENTRHNVGFMVVNLLLKKLTSVKDSVWEVNKKFNSMIAKLDQGLMLIKPQSFMNASGEVVAKLMKFYKISPYGLYIIHDELDLPLGKVKITYGRGCAGHKGVESIIEKIGSVNFVRIRVGIGSGKKVRDPEKYVLSNFEEKETVGLRKIVKKSAEAMEFILEKGVERAANRYNQ